MPALVNIVQCEHTNIGGTFESLNGGYAGVYGWIVVNLLGIDEISGMASYAYSSYQPWLGSWIFEFTPGGEYIAAEITDCAINTNLCILENGSIGPIPPPEEEGADDLIWDLFTTDGISYPSMIQWDTETQTITYLFTTPGIYWITLLSTGDPKHYIVYKFTVTNCYEEYAPCDSGESSFPVNIGWYNRIGGWQNYVWFSRRTINKQIGDVQIFKASGRIQKKISIKDIYDGAEVPSGIIPISHLNYVEEMKYTIQAFLYNSESENWDIPILISSASFVVREEGNGFYRYNFEYILATEIIAQNQ